MVEETTRDAVRKLAEFEAAAAVETRSKLIDEHNSAFRWIVASLFALNGGAILSIFGRSESGLADVMPAFWPFFGGVVATFLTVVFAQISDRMMIARMHQWGLYWTTVGLFGERDEDKERDIKGGIAGADSVGRFARLLALFAMIFFVLGILATVVLEQKARVDRLEAQLSQSEVLPER